MAPEAQMDWAEISLASKPRSETHNLTAVLRVLDIIVGVILVHLTVYIMMWDRGVEGVADFYRI